MTPYSEHNHILSRVPSKFEISPPSITSFQDPTTILIAAPIQDGKTVFEQIFEQQIIQAPTVRVNYV